MGMSPVAGGSRGGGEHIVGVGGVRGVLLGARVVPLRRCKGRSWFGDTVPCPSRDVKRCPWFGDVLGTLYSTLTGCGGVLVLGTCSGTLSPASVGT